MADDRTAVLTAIDSAFGRYLASVFERGAAHLKNGAVGSHEVIEDALDRALTIRGRMVAHASKRLSSD